MSLAVTPLDETTNGEISDLEFNLYKTQVTGHATIVPSQAKR